MFNKFLEFRWKSAHFCILNFSFKIVLFDRISSIWHSVSSTDETLRSSLYFQPSSQCWNHLVVKHCVSCLIHCILQQECALRTAHAGNPSFVMPKLPYTSRATSKCTCIIIIVIFSEGHCRIYCIIIALTWESFIVSPGLKNVFRQLGNHGWFYFRHY